MRGQFKVNRQLGIRTNKVLVHHDQKRRLETREFAKKESRSGVFML